MEIKIALAGNPNTGKTTLFNALTGSNQFVGNWPGVTVMATFIIGLIVAAVIYAAAHKMYSDKKKGRSPSGCNCQGCANSHICHGSKEK